MLHYTNQLSFREIVQTENLVNNKRNCLLPENVDRMPFLYKNLNDQPLRVLDDEDSEEVYLFCDV